MRDIPFVEHVAGSNIVGSVLPVITETEKYIFYGLFSAFSVFGIPTLVSVFRNVTISVILSCYRTAL